MMFKTLQRFALVVPLALAAHTAPAQISLSAPVAVAPKPAAAAPDTSAFGIADIGNQSGLALAKLKDVERRAVADDSLASIRDELATLARGVDVRTVEVRRLLRAHPSLDRIRSLQSGWDSVDRSASRIAADVGKRVSDMDALSAGIDQMAPRWAATHAAAASAGAPADLVARVAAVETALDHARKSVAARRTEAVDVQAKSDTVNELIASVKDSLASAQKQAIRQLLHRDSAPVWSADFWTLETTAGLTPTDDPDPALATQFDDVHDFLVAHGDVVLFAAALLFMLIVGQYVFRPRIRRWTVEDPALADAAVLLEVPIATSLMLVFVLVPTLLRQPPALLSDLLTAAAVLPTALVVRRLVDITLRPIVYALMGFFLLDTIRDFIAPTPGIARVVFLVEMILVVFFWLWLAKRKVVPLAGATEAVSGPPHGWRAPQVIAVGARIGLAVAAAVLVIDLIGLDRLADEMGSALQISAYAAMVLYALIRVAIGVILGGLHFPGVSRLGTVRNHRPLVENTVSRWAARLGTLAWLVFMLRHIGLWDQSTASLGALMKAGFKIGSIAITVEEIVAFVAVIYLTGVVSRLVHFVLDEEVYPKLNLARGLPYAVSTMVRYVIMVIGFIVALGVLGIDMTKFTILAGAFSVGLGFGLQNIVNNFVSGIIVLFERPVKVGDMVQFGDITGAVERIGIRATVVRGFNGAEMIVPNGKLISDNVTNWTFSNTSRRIDIPVLAALGSDADAVKRILMDAANSNTDVAKDPPPDALLTTLGPDSLQFDLRVWVAAEQDWGKVRSDLASSVNAALRSAGIAFK